MTPTVRTAFRDVVVRGGDAGTGSGANGGGMLTTGRAELDRVRLTENRAVVGGGLYVSDSVDVNATTVDANVATTGGGGIGAAGTASSVAASTISGNAAPTGAGLSGSISMARSTVADNVGATTVSGAGFRPRATILSTSSGSVCGASVTSQGWNVLSDSSCGTAGTGDQVGVGALLGPLAENGGPTLTHLPGVGSPAIDAIPVGTPGLCDGTMTTDQRGNARPAGPACDVGAVER